MKKRRNREDGPPRETFHPKFVLGVNRYGEEDDELRAFQLHMIEMLRRMNYARWLADQEKEFQQRFPHTMVTDWWESQGHETIVTWQQDSPGTRKDKAGKFIQALRNWSQIPEPVPKPPEKLHRWFECSACQPKVFFPFMFHPDPQRGFLAHALKLHPVAKPASVK